MIHTKRLQLLPVEQFHKEAFSRSRDELGTVLGVTLPDGWPQFTEAFSLPIDDAATVNPTSGEWCGYFFIDPVGTVLVGNGGFNGGPDESGTVEIGYEIAPQFWNRGFATEAVRGMIDYAFTLNKAEAVIAHTLAERNASNRVLEKADMNFVAETDNPEVGKVWEWRICRNE